MLFLTILFYLTFLSFPQDLAGQNLSSKRVLIFSIYPYLSVEENYYFGQKITKNLAQKMGVELEFRVYSSSSEFEKDYFGERFDFALVPPPFVIWGYKKRKYIPLIRNIKPLSVVLFVNKNSKFKSVKDLDNATIALPSPHVMASIFYKQFLSDYLKLKITPKYVETPENVIKHVLLGLAQVGAVVKPVLLAQGDEILNNFLILHESPPFPSRAIVAHYRVPQRIRNLFVENFLGLKEAPEFQQALQKLQISHPVKADYNRDYKQLEIYNLEKFLPLK
ncbi:MAG: phosphate/phosphite/phosphonate ABC transporter substrate-binding protein [Caldimicrobium sp.]|nr:phosphate/phosphite/phosphonate ABC transporter substrate-binding protein [Caldimicrobium sp.]MCX7874401.1 phosphate/phosphite/phosphonate ABC transporter substrate-binding protein [Caldimicrobium sp.]MDW8094014.1 PhnD/SsuA/transferrin family substrate-binding protein [Caldimicrobium sp.]